MFQVPFTVILINGHPIIDGLSHFGGLHFCLSSDGGGPSSPGGFSSSVLGQRSILFAPGVEKTGSGRDS